MMWADSLIKRALRNAGAEEAEYLEPDLREGEPVMPSRREAEEYSSRVYGKIEEFLAGKGMRIGQIMLVEKKKRR
jgi:hypothetical protein